MMLGGPFHDRMNHVDDGNFRAVAATGDMGICGVPPSAEEPARDPNYDSNRPVAQRGCYPEGAGAVVNAGTYTGELNVVSLSARYHFD